MCCSVWPATFSKTITGTWEVLVENKINHVLWYQNRVGNQTHDQGPRGGGVAGQVFEVVVRQAMAGAPWREICAGPMEVNGINPIDVEKEAARRKQGLPPLSYGQTEQTPVLRRETKAGNALVIPLLGSWESIKLLNTYDMPDILADIDHAVREPEPEFVGWGALSAMPMAAGGVGRMVFVKFDIYDIVIAENASMIPNVISQIQPRKRPEINAAVFHSLEALYDAPFALCCFNSADSGEAKPLAFAFEPANPDELRIYTLDGHDGNPPNLDAAVTVDHTVFTGSFRNPYGARVNFTNATPAHMLPYTLNTVLGQRVHQRMMNGDFVCNVDDVRSGLFRAHRQLPPKAPPREPSSTLTRHSSDYVSGVAKP